MTEQEMINSLQSVWENMTWDKDKDAYKEMLMLLDSMTYYLRYDLQCECSYNLPLVETEGYQFMF